MTKKIFAISLLIIISMIILSSSWMLLHGSLTEVKEQEQEKRQQQHLAYATPTLTRPPPSSSSSLPSSTDFNFAAAGDWGCTDDTSSTIKNIQNKDPELILALGDLSYEKTAKCWLDETSSIKNKLKIAMGNHEAGDEGDPTLLQVQYRNNFNLSKTYYSFDYHNVHFIAIDSMLPYTINSPQYSFVKNDLISTSQNPNIRWIIVYFHHPMYTSPTKHPSDILLRDTYHPLFDQYGVDLVLQGHNHNYQRSYPITYNNKGNSPNPTITSANTNTYNNPRGEIYVIAGTAGEDLYDLKSKADFIATQYKGFGFLNLDISSDGTKLIGTFYANEDGSVKDTFNITKLSNSKLIAVKEQFYPEKLEVLNAKHCPCQ
jgi:predicted MPP superfamily phosphohydrolase